MSYRHVCCRHGCAGLALQCLGCTVSASKYLTMWWSQVGRCTERVTWGNFRRWPGRDGSSTTTPTAEFARHHRYRAGAKGTKVKPGSLHCIQVKIVVVNIINYSPPPSASTPDRSQEKSAPSLSGMPNLNDQIPLRSCWSKYPRRVNRCCTDRVMKAAGSMCG